MANKEVENLWHSFLFNSAFSHVDHIFAKRALTDGWLIHTIAKSRPKSQVAAHNSTDLAARKLGDLVQWPLPGSNKFWSSSGVLLFFLAKNQNIETTFFSEASSVLAGPYGAWRCYTGDVRVCIGSLPHSVPPICMLFVHSAV